MLDFHGVDVEPGGEAYGNRRFVEGGPIWPDFEDQTYARQILDGAPADRCPEHGSEPRRRLSDDCVWGGYARPHFGHLAAEHLTRLPQSLSERPDDLYLFIADRGQGRADLPPYFWSLLDWFGLPRERAMIVTEPLRVDRLHVAAQGEYLRQSIPSRTYLDLVEAACRRNGLAPIPSDTLYVGRQGQIRKGRGGHAGEGYLIDLLRRNGIRILDPGATPLREQLALYAGAARLLFAEGSAIHGRQLVGRVDQEIFVLNRRERTRTALQMLRARCRRITYIVALEDEAAPGSTPGRQSHPQGLAFFDTESILDFFHSIGIDLRRDWSHQVYEAWKRADMAAWLRARRARAAAPDFWRRHAGIGAIFARQGAGDLVHDLWQSDGAPAPSPFGEDEASAARAARFIAKSWSNDG